MQLSQSELEKRSEALAIAGVNLGLPKFIKRVSDAFKAKGLTLAKIIRMYAVVEKAVADIEAIVKEK